MMTINVPSFLRGVGEMFATIQSKPNAQNQKINDAMAKAKLITVKVEIETGEGDRVGMFYAFAPADAARVAERFGK